MYRQLEKKLVKQQYLLYMSTQYGELGPLAAEIVSLVWGTPGNFNGFRVFGSVTARQSSSGRQPSCGVEQRAPPIFGRAAITLGIAPHFFSLLWGFKNHQFLSTTHYSPVILMANFNDFAFAWAR